MCEMNERLLKTGDVVLFEHDFIADVCINTMYLLWRIRLNGRDNSSLDDTKNSDLSSWFKSNPLAFEKKS